MVRKNDPAKNMETTTIEIKRTKQIFHFQGAVESDEATAYQLLHNSNVESEDEGDKSDLEEEILKEKAAQMKGNILTLTSLHCRRSPTISVQQKNSRCVSFTLPQP